MNHMKSFYKHTGEQQNVFLSTNTPAPAKTHDPFVSNISHAILHAYISVVFSDIISHQSQRQKESLLPISSQEENTSHF